MREACMRTCWQHAAKYGGSLTGWESLSSNDEAYFFFKKYLHDDDQKTARSILIRRVSKLRKGYLLPRLTGKAHPTKMKPSSKTVESTEPVKVTKKEERKKVLTAIFDPLVVKLIEDCLAGTKSGDKNKITLVDLNDAAAMSMGVKPDSMRAFLVNALVDIKRLKSEEQELDVEEE